MIYAKKEIVTESDIRMKAFKSEMNVKQIPYRLRTRTYIGEKFHTFIFSEEYAPESLKLWQKICLSIPDV